MLYHGVGRKKKSVARVFLKTGNQNLFINNKKINNYFNKKLNYKLIFQPLKLFNLKNIGIKINTYGGGKTSQITAIRAGISKALLKYNKNYKKILSDNKMLTRDSRVVERKKVGKCKSRKGKQFSKR